MIFSTSSADRKRDLRPCTLMMVQKLHWNGQPRPASNVVRALRLRRIDARQERRRSALQAGQAGTVIVERLEATVIGILEQRIQLPLGLARKDRYSERPGLPDLRRRLRQHRQASRSMEAADAHGNAGGSQRASDVHRARELVRLDT